MKELPRNIIAIAIGIMTFVALRYLFPSSPAPETARLECSFTASQTASAAPLNSAGRFKTLVVRAKLTGKSVHAGDILWDAEGVTSYRGGSQRLAGVVFLLPSNKVRGLMLYRDNYPHTADDLRISTLNEDSMLDWNERSAFIYLEGAADKRANAFDYRCNVTQEKSD